MSNDIGSHDPRSTSARPKPPWGPEVGASAALWHQWRADDASPFWRCHACGVERRFHGEDGRTNHWFVKPREVSA
jgi:hypothetical protein